MEPGDRRINKWLFTPLALALVWVGSLLVAGTAATAPPPQGPNEIHLGALNNGAAVDLTEGDVLVLSLDSNPATGYEWQVADVDRAVLQQAAEVQYEPEVPPGLQSGANPPPVLGAPERTILRFQARAPGRTALRLVYGRPWKKDAPPARSYALEVRGVGAFTGQFRALPTATPVPPAAAAGSQPLLGAPAHLNWCEQGGCTPVRDQGGCGSCWAFATVGVLESAIKIKDGQERDLSEQYLVSCNTEGMSCGGGWFAHSYHWFRVPPGEPSAGARYEADFPYQATNVPCNPPHAPHETLIGYSYVAGYTVPPVSDVKQAILDHGPVGTGVCVGSAFHAYTGGVFGTNETCSGIVNHAVVLVGWDDADGVWYLRNSWGTDWGEDGYMRIKWGISMVGWGANYVTYEAATPTAPSGLTATAVSQAQIDLGWTDNSTDESDFHVERSPDGSTGWTGIYTATAGSTSTSDTGLTCGTTYYYRLRAHRHSDGQYSSYSNTANATTPACPPPNAPSVLTATAASQAQINLSWTDNSTDESDFHVERSPDGSAGWTGIYTATANSTSTSDTGLTCGTAQYYRLRAHRHSDGQYSTYSNTANATTPACQPLIAPSRLSARAASRTQINVSWTDNAPDESDYHVERSLRSNTGWTAVYTAAANATGYINIGLSCSTAYYYRVRAHRHADGQYSAYSNTARAATAGCRTRMVANDDISGALPIADQSYGIAQDISEATTMTDDPDLPCVATPVDRTVWYSYTAAFTGTLTVDTFGSDYDTALAVWTGEPGALQNAGCNDNSDQTLQSRLQVPVSFGTIYFIEVADLSGAGTCGLQLNVWAAPPGDPNLPGFRLYLPAVLR